MAEASIAVCNGGRVGTRLLIIDDDPFVLRCLKRVLREHDLHGACDGKSALAVLEADRDFDLLLCDLSMPNVGGAALHAAITRRWPGLEQRIVFMTGGPLSESDQEFMRGLNTPSIAKPFQPAELRNQIREIAAQARDASGPHCTLGLRH